MFNLKSDLHSLKTKDFIKGAIMAVIVPVLVIVQQSIAAGDLVLNWKAIGMAAIAGFIGYLTKNFFTDGVAEAQKTIAKAEAEAAEVQFKK